MAAALLQNLAARYDLEIEVDSAGVGAREGDDAAGLARRTLKGRGIELTGHNAKCIRNEVIKWADVVLGMTTDHKDTLARRYPGKKDDVFTLGEYVGVATEVPDPLVEGTPEAYERCAHTLAELLSRLVVKLNQADLG